MTMTQERSFRIFTVGWERLLIENMLCPIGALTGIQFTHGLVGDSRRLLEFEKSLPGVSFVALSKANHETLPDPDYELLASLESVGVPTIRSMVQGDRVLRSRSANESLGYATLLARRIRSSLTTIRPDVVLGGFDSLHGSLSLAVAKSLDIPWVAMSFPVIPDNLTGFCYGVTPESLVPIRRTCDKSLLHEAEALLCDVRSNGNRVLAWRAPMSLRERFKDSIRKGFNLAKRAARSRSMGVDRFTWPTAAERFGDIVRRSINFLRLPTERMLSVPPESRFAYLPLQMQPESSIDTWAIFFQDQLALVRQVAFALPVDVKLIVKLHFSDPDNYSRSQLMQLTQIPGLHIAHPNSPGFPFLQKASLVITIHGTASLEAALLGQPVLMFGDSPYQHFPRTERARRTDELPQQIREMLAKPQTTDATIVEAFSSYMARYMPGRVNDWSRTIERVALSNYVECFQGLRLYIEEPGCSANWYKVPPFADAKNNSA